MNVNDVQRELQTTQSGTEKEKSHSIRDSHDDIANNKPFRKSPQNNDFISKDQTGGPWLEKDADLESGNRQQLPEEYEAVEPPQESGEREPGDASLEVNKIEQTPSNVSFADSMSLPRELLFVTVICLGQFMTQVGLSGTLAIVHIIGAHFGLTNPAELSWLIAGYSLTVGTFILIAGRMGDVFGHKNMFILGFVWYALWSMIAGVSFYSNHVLFTFARVFQGIGPAMVMPNGVAILGRAYSPGPRKAMAFAAFGGCAPGGAVAGIAFAGLFALTWWPWTFLALAIGLIIIAAAAYFIIPPTQSATYGNMPLIAKIRELDLFGGAVGVAALVLFNFAWNQAPIVGWHEPYVYVTLILGLLLAPIFFFIELKVSRHPLIPFAALSPDVAFVLICISCGWACFGIWVFYIFQFFEVLRHASPLLVAAYISPAAVVGFVAAGATGWLLGRLQPAWVMIMAMTAFLTGSIIIATCPVDQIYWAQTFVCALVIPFGMDMSFPAGTLILSNSVDKKAQGIAASLVTTIVNYSISLGLGFAGTVEVHVNNGGKTRSEVLEGYRGAWYMGIGLAGLGLAVSVSFLLKGYWKERKGHTSGKQ